MKNGESKSMEGAGVYAWFHHVTWAGMRWVTVITHRDQVQPYESGETYRSDSCWRYSCMNAFTPADPN